MTQDKDKPKSGSGMSRRDFIRGSTAGALSTGLISGGLVGVATEAEAASTDIVGPDAVPVALRVNGKAYTVRVEPRVTLLEALRDHIGLTGSKNVCDRGTCGACTVIMEGRPVYACSVLAIDASGNDILTIEGLGTPENMHPIQKAFVDNDAQQCGFCTPGFIMACHAFIEDHPNPTPEQINQGLGGNLCRCGSYVGVRKAVAEAAGKGGANHG
jgi:aerobic-type carbon monoxide dehydrogenase small subunit (CoxS/CutS family)